MYTQLGVLTKGTIIEVNMSELGLVAAGGKVRYNLPLNSCLFGSSTPQLLKAHANLLVGRLGSLGKWSIP